MMNMNLQQPDGNITAVMQFAGNTYNLSQFSISFSQSIDKKGEPQAEVRGGKVLLVLSQVPDNALLQWASSQWARKDGEVIFRNETGTPPLRIIFKGAYCTHLETVAEANSGGFTTIEISSPQIDMNGYVHENDWKD